MSGEQFLDNSNYQGDDNIFKKPSTIAMNSA